MNEWWMVNECMLDVGWIKYRGRKLKYMLAKKKMQMCTHSKHHHTHPQHTIDKDFHLTRQ